MVALDPSLSGLDDCGCCAGTSARTPEQVFNRAGLAGVSYRVGTHSSFLASMLAGLSSAERPHLRSLSTREGADFTIAFLDAVATAADVLTFYGERIANESYLRTAGERLSLLQLARAIGYELAPGVAAEATLAFELEQAEGAPSLVEIEAGTKVQSVPGPGERPQTFETVAAVEARPQWNELRPRASEPRNPALGDTETYVAGVATNLEPGDAILIVGEERAQSPGAEQWDLRLLDAVEPDPARNVTRLSWRSPLGSHVPHVEPARVEPRIYAMRLRASLFGSSAPEWRMLSEKTREEYVKVTASGSASSADWPGLKILVIAGEENVVHLDGVHPGILAQPARGSRPESWLVLSRQGYRELFRVVAVDESARHGFGLALKTTRVELDGEGLAERFDESVRDAVAYAQSEPLEFAEWSIGDPVRSRQIELAGRVPALPAGRAVLVSGRPSDATDPAARQTEPATVVSSETAGGVTRIVLGKDLSCDYARETVRIAANVAPATHGEASVEPIGSGDAGAAFQRFDLRQAPLTHVYADTPEGRRSTLELRVGGLRWEEVPSLSGRGPHERVYSIRRDEEGATTVEFGDGRTGARLPSGQENVVAAYRKGLGREGNVGAAELTLLTARPLGVRAVGNPLPASGGSDPEQLGEARANAPLTVLTLGRIVSLSDYASFARAFEGVTKAHATWAWGAEGREVLLSVAGPNGAKLLADDPLRRNLLAAVSEASDPEVEVRLRSYDPRSFRLAATIAAREGVLAEKLLADAGAALAERFCFAARDLGQSVALSEVLAVLHGVLGVASVDVDNLYVGKVAELRRQLLASLPGPGEDAASAAPAQLLTLDLQPGDLEVVG